MVFKGRFFSSKKSSDSSKSDASTATSSSPISIRSDKKKVKSVVVVVAKDETQQISSSGSGSGSSSSLGSKKNEIKGKELPKASSSSSLKLKKSPISPDVKDGSHSVSPILASSLGLNRIKTRSGPLPQECFYGLRGEKGLSLASSNLSRPVGNDAPESSAKNVTGKKKDVQSLSKMVVQDNVLSGHNNWVDQGSNSDSMSTDSVQSRDQSPVVQLRSRLQNGDSSSGSQMGQCNISSGLSGCLRSSDVSTPEPPFDCETPKESESPRFQAILRLTSAPRKRFPADIKSFSHELNSKGVRPFPFWKPRGLNNLEEVLVVIRAKFDKAKEEVDSDLAVFAGDLVGILEKNAETHPDWLETIEDLLVLARRCAIMSSGEFWLQCEGIVQDLDDRRQELPMGILKQLHTRMLFILTRCTRLLQFHKESGLSEEQGVGLRQSRVMHSADKRVPPSGTSVKDVNNFNAARGLKAASARKFYSQEHRGLDWKRDIIKPPNFLSPTDAESAKSCNSPSNRNRMASWKKLPSPAEKPQREPTLVNDELLDNKVLNNMRDSPDVEMISTKLPELPPAKDFPLPSKHQHKVSWGYWGDQQTLSDEHSILCRICEEEVLTSHVEDHSRICAIADRCDQKGLRVDDRLNRIAETLEKMMESFSQKDFLHNAVGSPDVTKVSNSSVTEESDGPSPKLSDWSRRGSEDMLDCLPEPDSSIFMDDLRGLPSMSCKTRLGPKTDQGMATSSAGSMTPRSPLWTPRLSQIDLLLAVKGVYSENEDIPQMNELADIARCVANTLIEDERSVSFLVTCLEDLRVVVDRRKRDALTVETFGTRIEKLIKEKYLQLCELVDDEKGDMTTIIDEDAPLEDDVVRSLRTSPIHQSSKDRTSIDDFEIIKPISRGAFGRVFLAKKRTTGDLFAIKVLKKADMIRKNAVESILAERDILISVRNPFVVRFFYSFTCRENLYLVMEYLNGGDLYSLLRNLGCLDEDIVRVYIAEIVLALEYLHSLRVVHRDLKPDNLLIAHDGHLKLTDFGLSKVGLINSTDDLSGPAVRGTTADWWSVGIILFELIVGIPPFNAEHPQSIFDNILNRKIPWPRVPEEMSFEAEDLIDGLLTEDPNQRLGANGASEVKQHAFFKDINWDTLARQKAAFVPSSESPLDTSYFTSRHSWNPLDERVHVHAASEFEDFSDSGSMSGTSSCSYRQDDLGDNDNDKQGYDCGGLSDFESGSSVNYSFSNFSFKNLSQLASINYDLLTKGWKDEPQ
ncbi:hypothetical protein GIB67_020934 [Kingdonia uniflora]|uniref:non-specific serine/threonine protein kinase n=1 Tax=Kingdonia uniflora TaxID=39325 RepID=A0A7J7M7H7_9MAGN|nr:hypothetical protein GIB67_020934 [Kingdonia uniflora]